MVGNALKKFNFVFILIFLIIEIDISIWGYCKSYYNAQIYLSNYLISGNSYDLIIKEGNREIADILAEQLQNVNIFKNTSSNTDDLKIILFHGNPQSFENINFEGEYKRFNFFEHYAIIGKNAIEYINKTGDGEYTYNYNGVNYEVIGIISSPINNLINDVVYLNMQTADLYDGSIIIDFKPDRAVFNAIEKLNQIDNIELQKHEESIINKFISYNNDNQIDVLLLLILFILIVFLIVFTLLSFKSEFIIKRFLGYTHLRIIKEFAFHLLILNSMIIFITVVFVYLPIRSKLKFENINLSFPSSLALNILICCLLLFSIFIFVLTLKGALHEKNN